jgi:PAS domain S-box-containing protein
MATRAGKEARISSINRGAASLRGPPRRPATGSAAEGGLRPEPPSDAQIVESAIDAIVATDPSGRIKRWNQGAEALYGYSAKEVLEKPVGLILPPGRPSEHEQLFPRVLAGERIEHYRTSRRRKDGSTVDVSLTMFPLLDAAGHIVGAASIARDISAHLVAERELRASEGRYRQLLDAAYEGVWRIDTQLVTDYANQSMAEMLGYSVEEMLGRGLSDFLDEDGTRRAQASTLRQREGTKERLEVYFLRKDRTRLPALISVSGIFDEAGTYVGNLAMCTDVSEQREAEARHRETEGFLESVAASMDEGLLTLDGAGRITAVNDQARRLLGYEQHELLDRTLCESVGREPRDGPPSQRAGSGLASISSSSSPMRLDDEVFTCRDGSCLPVALSAAPLGERAGALGHVVVFRVLAERHAAEESAQRELEEMGWIGHLRDAIDEERLVLAAQPIVSLLTGEVTRQELLVRLRDRAGRLVMPGEFLPAAERFGLIRDLDRWVLGQAVRLAAEQQTVNVNLSAHSLGDPHLADAAERMLSEAGAEPWRITFEITETAVAEHLERARKFATQMSELGCQFALDDFGTGYGAFTYLKMLPINYLKIDREFVHDLPENPASRHLVEAMVSLARCFGQQTIAEGVEDAGTLEILRELGVDHAQGYYIAPPGGAARPSGSISGSDE